MSEIVSALLSPSNLVDFSYEKLLTNPTVIINSPFLLKNQN